MKIHIIGGTGSGKSFLGRELSAKYHIPVLDLDTIFWSQKADRYNVKNSKEMRDRALSEFMQNDDYIIEGIYYSWMNEAFEKADRIIVLDVPIGVRMYRIIKRFILRKLGLIQTKKETIGDLYRLIRWNFEHLKDGMPQILALNEKYPDKVMVCKQYCEK